VTYFNTPTRRLVGAGTLTVLAAGIASSWAWNRLAADLGGLPHATYVNGLAVAVAVFALAAAAGFGLRLASGAGRS
jgi:hypothetical protein